jgi:uncharacterized protein with GYD domain
MATYVMLTTLTDQGRKTIKENPQRIKRLIRKSRLWGLRY